MSQTAAAAAVLWKSLASVMSSANQEMRSGFEFRVAALLADIAAASGARRSAIVGASGGAVVDWLLETVGTPGRDRSGTREEAARALAYLVADPGVCESVLGRPGAVPNLLRFIFWFQPKGGKKYKNSSLDSPGQCKGRSMLVAALMDIITSNCDTVDFSSFHPLLPGKADMRDIAAALEVVEEGGIHLDDQHGEKDDDDGDKGMKGIGIKVLGGTTILGFSKTNDLVESDGGHLQLTSYISRNMALRETSNKFLEPERASITVPGLWDDLQREHVAVPFAAWALANWALASEINRSHIQELDRDGHAIMTALTARERTVKWHGSLVARALLDDQNLPLTFSVPSWSSSLLSTAFHASKVGDISLAQVALSAFVVSAERSDDAKKAIMGKGLHLMREITKQAERHRNLQELLARVLELLYAGNMHLSVEEAQRWSGTLLRWIFGASASDSLRISATKILSLILEDYGPASIPISQGWLTICLNEIIEASKISALNGSTPLKTDKTQIDQSNALSAVQAVNQLATAVIKLASNQLESESDSVDKFSFADLLSLEPFAPLFRSMKKTNMPKFDAADSALATLKSVKALSELCSGDVACQNKLADFGILCLLRRLLLSDDYENLAAIEAYDASRALEMQDRGSAASSDSSSVNSNDSSSVRVPPTAHIRRHAARLLRILSLLPKVKKAIIEDKDWCKWLEDCANGRIPCCNDLKTQSNARATLLNIFCSDQADTEEVNSTNPGMEGGSQKTKCAQYQDMIFLINPELPHWKCPEKNNLVISQDLDVTKRPVSTVYSSPSDSSESIINENSDTSRFLDTSDSSDSPLLDIIFIHGLRGGPFKSWRIADNKSSTTSKAGLVEHIDQEAGREGTCWPREWLSADFPYARLLTVKYKVGPSDEHLPSY